MFLRGNNEILVEQELIKLQSQTNQSNNSAKSVGLCDLFKDRATRKGLIISFMLLGSQQFSGIFAMVSIIYPHAKPHSYLNYHSIIICR